MAEDVEMQPVVRQWLSPPKESRQDQNLDIQTSQNMVYQCLSFKYYDTYVLCPTPLSSNIPSCENPLLQFGPRCLIHTVCFTRKHRGSDLCFQEISSCPTWSNCSNCITLWQLLLKKEVSPIANNYGFYIRVAI